MKITRRQTLLSAVVILVTVAIIVAAFSFNNDSEPGLASPVIADIPEMNVLVASTVVIPIAATNPNKMMLAFTMEGAPAGATMVKDGIIFWKPKAAGEYSFDIKVNDTMAPVVRKTVTIIVANDTVPRAPTIEPLALGLLRANVTITQSVKAYDANGDSLTYSVSEDIDDATIDNAGTFTWTPDDDGVYTFDIVVSDGTHDTTRQVIATVVDGFDVITRWNIELGAYLNQKAINNQYGSRAMAMMHTAMFDAVNSIDKDYVPYHVNMTGPANASMVAAAAAAAHRVVTSLYPSDSAMFDAVYDSQMASIPESDAKSDGAALGQEVADAIIELRSDDNSANANPPFPDGMLPGQYRRTSMMPPLMPGWGTVTTWALSNGSQFRLPAPPALSSAEYAAAYNETRDLGARRSMVRTAEQSEDALFWIAGVPDHWHGVAREMAARDGMDVHEKARLFALLSVTLADASISGWDSKYTYRFWRPMTAIQNGDADENPATMAMANWMPFITTPPFPEYASGHSTTCMSGAALLASFFGSDEASYVRMSATPGLPAHEYNSFSEMAEEAGASRISAGVHFSFSNTAALNMGTQIGEYVYGHVMQAI